MRRTIQRPAELAGTGLHTGAAVRLRVAPARGGAGVRFRRIDLDPPVEIAATLDAVGGTERRTVLAAGDTRIETVEHLLAAAAAAEIDDLLVLVDGPELPILDGSFAPYCALLSAGGILAVAGRRRALVVDAPFEVREGDARYLVEPAGGCRLEVTLEHVEPVIGRQHAVFAPGDEPFVTAIAPARTYGFLAEVEALRARGLLAGASADAAIVLSATAPLNTTLRWPEEFARHKVGDLLGDLALLGGPLRAAVRAWRPSHRGNIACARAIAARARPVEEE
ncbi:MAG: UDP-3-O-[3-hydroxymyristoyl] N-acetylglucosamine deacetylase [Gemmatimonadetes bacterium]|nr:UDP-3-O-[3-hydroxymyristoyl] N-acetylglucosamine deacetylase [Gemmatimonadota bacterium]